MDARAHEPPGSAPHGLVTVGPRRRSLRSTGRASSGTGRAVARGAAFAALVCLLAAGVTGGLARAGIARTPVAGWVLQAALSHAALMVGGFLGTVIAIERAVAVHRREAFAVPLASALGAALLAAGQGGPGGFLLLAASLGFVAVNVLVVRRQPAPHTALLLVAALAWCAGNALWVGGREADAVLPWWLAFLVLTIAAERLEMTRLMPRRRGASPALWGLVVLLLGAAAVSGRPGPLGGVLFGLALTGLAAWLLAVDIARRTVRTDGLSRYMAVCLLVGYAWLGFGGIAWTGTALGCPARDAALHAIGLGFIVSMVMAHAPVILPAVAGIRLRYSAAFYLPFVLLHASLLVRVASGFVPVGWRPAGVAGNALALLFFGLTVGCAARANRRAACSGAGHRTRHP